jgi:hypothetical protein
MQRNCFPRLRLLLLRTLCAGSISSWSFAQAPVVATPRTPNTAATPGAVSLQSRTSLTEEQKEAARIAALGHINGRPYDRPSNKQQFHDYLHDTYGWPGVARTTVRTLYAEALDHPSGWGQDFPGFAQRFGSNTAITAINGTVRLGMETVFQEDMKYIPCHGCSVKRKIGNALLAEVTARHDVDGHRFFTLTPVISDFSGPIIANAFWYPNHDPASGAVAARTVFATRIGAHLFTEFILERRHRDPKLEDHQNDPRAHSTSSASQVPPPVSQATPQKGSAA